MSSEEEQRTFVEFRSAEGDSIGGQVALSLSLTTQNLEVIINKLLNNVYLHFLFLLLNRKKNKIHILFGLGEKK
jgi:uncharacterized membrane protein